MRTRDAFFSYIRRVWVYADSADNVAKRWFCETVTDRRQGS